MFLLNLATIFNPASSAAAEYPSLSRAMLFTRCTCMFFEVSDEVIGEAPEVESETIFSSCSTIFDLLFLVLLVASALFLLTFWYFQVPARLAT